MQRCCTPIIGFAVVHHLEFVFPRKPNRYEEVGKQYGVNSLSPVIITGADRLSDVREIQLPPSVCIWGGFSDGKWMFLHNKRETNRPDEIPLFISLNFTTVQPLP